MRESQLVASIHSGSTDNIHPNRIGNIAKRFPDVPIIMDHLGYPDATADAIRVAEECPNVYLGTTILRFFKPPEEANLTAVAEAVRRSSRAHRLGLEPAGVPAQRPLVPPGAIEPARRRAEALIFGENLTRLYKTAG